jgi:hypothetical protein
MREVDFLKNFQPVAIADRRRSGGPFADAVHGQHSGAFIGRREERRRRVAQVMLAEQQLLEIEILRQLG